MKYRYLLQRILTSNLWWIGLFGLLANGCKTDPDVVFSYIPNMSEDDSKSDSGSFFQDAVIQNENQDSELPSSIYDQNGQDGPLNNFLESDELGPCTDLKEIFPDGICMQNKNHLSEVNLVASKEECTEPSELDISDEERVILENIINVWEDMDSFFLLSLSNCTSSCGQIRGIYETVRGIIINFIPIWAPFNEYYRENDQVIACDMTCFEVKLFFSEFLNIVCRSDTNN